MKILVTLSLVSFAALGCNRRQEQAQQQAAAATAQAQQAVAAAQAQAAQAVNAATAQAGAGATAAAGGAAQAITMGANVSGNLAAGASQDYNIDLTAGQAITIVARAAAPLDTVVEVLQGGNSVGTNDDADPQVGDNSLNSRLVYTPTAAGPHTIRVHFLGSDMTGAYTLSTVAGANASAM